MSEWRSRRVFQIAYDEMLLVTRAELLKLRGCEVSSALGNDEARRLLDKSQSYRLFIVGHAASIHTRAEMVKWLRTNFPDTKILALNPLSEPYLPGADYNCVLNGPQEWLAIVERVAA